MRAIVYNEAGAIAREGSLIDVVLDDPVARGRDLLVEVRAVALNPVDTKVRSTRPPQDGRGVLGYDAAGVVRSVGPEVTLFRTGDEVFYAGSIARPGTNSELHLVDERIVGRRPSSTSWAEAAALPLTSITSWEALFDRMDVRRPVPGAAHAVLVIGSGGVGSIAVQLARQLTDLTVIATASGGEATRRIQELGAHHVVDHTLGLAPQVADIGLGAPGFVFSTTHSDQHVVDIAQLIAPQGRFGLIDDLKVLDVVPFKMKAVSIHWELMFTRSMFNTPDMDKQGLLLNEIASLVDAGRLRASVAERLSPINAENLRHAHAMLEQGAVRGKITLEGWR